MISRSSNLQPSQPAMVSAIRPPPLPNSLLTVNTRYFILAPLLVIPADGFQVHGVLLQLRYGSQCNSLAVADYSARDCDAVDSVACRIIQPAWRQIETPAAAGVFVQQKESELHGCYKIGNDEGCIFLQQLGHAGCHAGIHLSGTEGIDADAFAGLREGVLA